MPSGSIGGVPARRRESAGAKKPRHAKAAGINYGYYGHNDFYPNKIAVVREVVQRQTIVVPARPDAAGRKVDPIPASPAEPAGQ